MQYWVGHRIKTNDHVHHINSNKLDARKQNLEILTKSVHHSITNKGKKQSPSHVFKRINSTTITRYGHSYKPLTNNQ